MTHLVRLLAHDAWADVHALAALRRAQDQGHDISRALGLLAHVVAAESIWLARIEQRTAPVTVWPTLSLDQCEQLARETHAGLLALGDTLREGETSRVVRYRNSAGTTFESSVDDMLLHVALHGAYHRGQIALLLRDAGAEPSATDYIAFVRGAPAAPRADAVSGQPSA